MPNKRADMRTAVCSVFPTRATAEQGLDLLRLSGFANGEISAVMPQGQGVSGVVSWLAGVEEITVPRAGSLLAAGPIVAALTKLGVSGALPGVVNAEHYESRVQQGAVLIAVHCSNSERVVLASDILKRSRGEDIAAPAARKARAGA